MKKPRSRYLHTDQHIVQYGFALLIPLIFAYLGIVLWIICIIIEA
jgi:phage shock protein PspC (stress-responsive transcriptional regulator)